MAEEVVGGVVEQAVTSGVDTAVAPSVPPDGTAGSGGMVQGSPGVDGGSAPLAGVSPPPQEWLSIRDALRGMGVDLPSRVKDDNAALAMLGAAYREAERLRGVEPLAREYQQYQGQFQAWRQQQSQASRQQQEQAKQWFKAPEFDARWESQLTRDPATGEIRVVADAPADTAQKYRAWADHQRTFMQKMAQDPIGAIKPGLEQLIEEKALRIVQQQMGSYQQQQTAIGFIQENSGWLHQRDADGNLVRDQQTGQPALSDDGRRFASYVQVAAQRGYDQDGQKEYAIALTQRDYALTRLGQQQVAQAGGVAVKNGEAAKQAFLQRQAGVRGPAAPGAGLVTPGVVTPANGNGMMTKEQLARGMMAKMKEAGFLPGQVIDS